MKIVLRLLFVLCSLGLVSNLKILPEETELTIEKNASLTLICNDDGPIKWTYPDGESEKRIAESGNENGTYESRLTLHATDYLDTGYFTCESKGNASRNAKIYIFVFDEDNLIAVNDSLVILRSKVHESIIVPCKPTSPEVNVSLTGADFEVANMNYNPKIGYIMQNVQVSDSNFLSCEGSYHDIESPSYAFQLIVNPSENEISDPYIDASGSYHLVEGDNATLNCSITVPVGVKIGLEWKYPNDYVAKKITLDRNKEYEHEKHKTLFRTLTIHNLTKTDQGPYTCEVNDDNMVAKQAVHHLLIHELNETFLNIKIQGESRELTRKAGESQIKWVVNVTAFPKPAILWYDPEGKEIKTGTSTDGKYVVTNDGQLTKLEIKNINVWDFGIYQMKAFNDYHFDMVNFSLIVEDKPNFLGLKNEKEFYLFNNSYSIECDLTGYPLPVVRWWYKNCTDTPACEGNPFQPVPTSRYEELAVKQYHMKSMYNFKATESVVLLCEATNSAGAANVSNVFLVTDVENDFAIKSNFKEIAVEDDIEITCGASKYRYHDNVTWYLEKSNEMLPVVHLPGIFATSCSSEFSYGSTLRIPKIQKHNSGSYVCRAFLVSATAAQYDEKKTNVFVNDIQKPVIANSNMNHTVWSVKNGVKVEMKVQVKGLPVPSITWYKNGKLLRINANDSSRVVILANQTSQALVIKYVTFTDEGEYSFMASNRGGNVSSKMTLQLIDKPEEHEHSAFIFGFSILMVFFLMCLAWSWVKIRKEKSFRKELKETGLLNFEEGAVHSLNPELGVEEQADLLPYDKKWEFPREKLKFGKLLGSGAFGEVRKAEADGIIDENNVTTVAVKTVKRNADPLYIRALASELKIMIHLGRHLNVVNLLGACTRDLNKRELAVIVEYCKYGNLHDFLLKQRSNFINQLDENGEIDFSITTNNNGNYYTAMNGRTTSRSDSASTEDTPIGSDGYLISKDNEPEWRSNYRGDYRNTTVRPIKTADLICWSFQIARGMEYLASRKVLHGDLAARNVLLADDNIVKICDFGLAKSMYQSENYQRKKTALLPVKWMAVESIRDRVFSTQSDVWSFGITMWELFMLSVTPYPGIEHLDNLYNKLESGYRLEKPTFASKELYAVMKDCWHDRPLLRPTFTELSERLGRFLEDGVRSHYTNLNEVYIKMNAEMNQMDYLAILNSPAYNSFEEPRYVNVPCREVSDPEDDVEMKPMLNKPDEKTDDTKPVCFFNQSYIDVTNPPRRPTYVNTMGLS